MLSTLLSPLIFASILGDSISRSVPIHLTSGLSLPTQPDHDQSSSHGSGNGHETMQSFYVTSNSTARTKTTQHHHQLKHESNHANSSDENQATHVDTNGHTLPENHVSSRQISDSHGSSYDDESQHSNQTGHGTSHGNVTHHATGHHGVSHHLVTWVSAACFLVFIIGAGFLFYFIFTRFRKGESHSNETTLKYELSTPGSSVVLGLAKKPAHTKHNTSSTASLPKHYHVTVDVSNRKHPQIGIDWKIGDKKVVKSSNEKQSPQSSTSDPEMTTSNGTEESHESGSTTSSNETPEETNADVKILSLPDYATAVTSDIYEALPEEITVAATDTEGSI